MFHFIHYHMDLSCWWDPELYLSRRFFMASLFPNIPINLESILNGCHFTKQLFDIFIHSNLRISPRTTSPLSSQTSLNIFSYEVTFSSPLNQMPSFYPWYFMLYLPTYKNAYKMFTTTNTFVSNQKKESDLVCHEKLLNHQSFLNENKCFCNLEK